MPLLLLLTLLLLLLGENQCFLLELGLRSLLGPLKEKTELVSEAPQEVGLEFMLVVVVEKEEDMVFVWMIGGLEGWFGEWLVVGLVLEVGTLVLMFDIV